MRSNTSCRPADALDYFSRALEVPSQVANRGGVCLVMGGSKAGGGAVGVGDVQRARLVFAAEWRQ